ncbi:hypothetical protein IT414_03955 [bacterium]|nr:hypothetical protein [bacterium]
MQITLPQMFIALGACMVLCLIGLLLVHYELLRRRRAKSDPLVRGIRVSKGEAAYVQTVENTLLGIEYLVHLFNEAPWMKARKNKRR